MTQPNAPRRLASLASGLIAHTDEPWPSPGGTFTLGPLTGGQHRRPRHYSDAFVVEVHPAHFIK
ncbi:MAG: hypothetical protein NTX33_19940 [Propionibacteriales bacterium]|nr:hypothetical protein [Propionibacteriales bacterium]